MIFFHYLYLDEVLDRDEQATADQIAKKISLNRDDCKDAFYEAQNIVREEIKQKHEAMLTAGWVLSTLSLCVCLGIGSIIGIVLAIIVMPYYRKQGRAWLPQLLIAWSVVTLIIVGIAVIKRF